MGKHKYSRRRKHKHKHKHKYKDKKKGGMNTLPVGQGLVESYVSSKKPSFSYTGPIVDINPQQVSPYNQLQIRKEIEALQNLQLLKNLEIMKSFGNVHFNPTNCVMYDQLSEAYGQGIIAGHGSTNPLEFPGGEIFCIVPDNIIVRPMIKYGVNFKPDAYFLKKDLTDKQKELRIKQLEDKMKRKDIDVFYDYYGGNYNNLYCGGSIIMNNSISFPLTWDDHTNGYLPGGIITGDIDMGYRISKKYIDPQYGRYLGREGIRDKMYMEQFFKKAEAMEREGVSDERYKQILSDMQAENERIKRNLQFMEPLHSEKNEAYIINHIPEGCAKNPFKKRPKETRDKQLAEFFKYNNDGIIDRQSFISPYGRDNSFFLHEILKQISDVIKTTQPLIPRVYLLESCRGGGNLNVEELFKEFELSDVINCGNDSLATINEFKFFKQRFNQFKDDIENDKIIWENFIIAGPNKHKYPSRIDPNSMKQTVLWTFMDFIKLFIIINFM